MTETPTMNTVSQFLSEIMCGQAEADNLKIICFKVICFFYIIFTHGLSDEEVEYLRSQFVTANISSKSCSNPYVFTEQGVYMLMTVLEGELAVRQSIALVRTFKKIFGETVYAGFYRAYQERRLFSYIKNIIQSQIIV